jgi:hypothetical protein
MSSQHGKASAVEARVPAPATKAVFWRIVLAGAVVFAIADALAQIVPFRVLASIGERVKDRSVVSEPMGIRIFITLIATVLAGHIADRWGAGRVVAAGVLASTLSIELFRTTEPGLAWNAVAVLLGIGAAAAGGGVIGPVVAQRLPEARRLLGVAILSAVPLLGSASWQLFTLVHGMDSGPVIAFIGLVGLALGHDGVFRLLETFQWKGAAVLASVLVVLCLPLSRRPAESAKTGETVRTGLAQRSYWLLGLGSLLAGMSSFLMVHLYGFLTVYGLTFSHAGNALGGAWLAYLSGGLLGVLLIACAQEAKLGVLLAMLACGRALGFAGLMVLPATTGWIAVSIFVLGACLLPVAPVSVALTARLTGTRWLATLYGLQFVLYGAGALLGVHAAGVLLDWLNSSYVMLWFAGCLASLMAATACFCIRERPEPNAEQPLTVGPRP